MAHPVLTCVVVGGVLGLATVAAPAGSAPPGVPVAEVLRYQCRVLEEGVARLIQDSPQRVVEVETYEWCVEYPRRWLLRRTFWKVDGVSTRSELVDTLSSRSTVLWEWRVEP